jgi:sulfofructose kinase
MHNISTRAVDVAGVGINATDTIIRLPHFPAPDSKVQVRSVDVLPGGQVATALVACRRWGLGARYVGKIGDDDAGRLQQFEMERAGVEAHWVVAPGGRSQSSFILVDETSGERTVLWIREPGVALRPGDIQREWIRGARALLVDGHDTAAGTQAARWAREEMIPVVGDFDNRYPGVETLLEFVDFPVTSRDFAERLTGESDLLRSLPRLLLQYKCRTICATLGRLGAIAWDGSRFSLCPAFRIRAIDTTGAGDIFHGAFLYGLITKWTTEEILEFSCAAAAMNCQAVGARGHIASIEEIQGLRRSGARSESLYTPQELLEASRAATNSIKAPE